MKFKDDKGKYLLEQIRDTAGQVNIDRIMRYLEPGILSQTILGGCSGLVVERQTPEREVQGSNPTVPV